MSIKNLLTKVVSAENIHWDMSMKKPDTKVFNEETWH